MASLEDQVVKINRKSIYLSTATAMELLAESIAKNYGSQTHITTEEVLFMLNGFAKLSRARAESL